MRKERSVLKTVRIKGEIDQKVAKIMEKRKWSFADCVEEGLTLLINQK